MFRYYSSCFNDVLAFFFPSISPLNNSVEHFLLGTKDVSQFGFSRDLYNNAKFGTFDVFSYTVCSLS